VEGGCGAASVFLLKLGSPFRRRRARWCRRACGCSFLPSLVGGEVRFSRCLLARSMGSTGVRADEMWWPGGWRRGGGDVCCSGFWTGSPSPFGRRLLHRRRWDFGVAGSGPELLPLAWRWRRRWWLCRLSRFRLGSGARFGGPLVEVRCRFWGRRRLRQARSSIKVSPRCGEQLLWLLDLDDVSLAGREMVCFLLLRRQRRRQGVVVGVVEVQRCSAAVVLGVVFDMYASAFVLVSVWFACIQSGFVRCMIF